jgi:hypothetical protein
MPILKRRGLQQLRLTPADLGVADLLSIQCGWRDREREREHPLFKSLDEVKAFWAEHRDEFLAAGDGLLGHRPGMRPWAWWFWDALPREPRLRTSDDTSLPATSTEPPSGCDPFDAGDGYESTAQYLTRLNLWQPGEREQLSTT